jgi:hypothetical protein
VNIDSNSDVQIKERLVLGCGALVYDLVRIIDQNPELSEKVELQCLPAIWHNKPQLIAPAVDKYLHEHANSYKEVYIAYADCGTGGELDRVLTKYNAKRIGGSHCYEFFAGPEAFIELTNKELGTFYLTDYLVKNFQRLIIEGLGLDKHPELFDAYFSNYKRLVYLAQTENEQWKNDAAKYADDFGFEYEYCFVGTGGLGSVFEDIELVTLKD